eukprot:TRINITY_DN44567_c0_g1_i1.p1 TRINITY_DN44567_c0_g1~~TRINITY_DN44567_c0_g1_i1.p1  ORF type:complete len:705 (+),score=48.69 TRINITY_DN44567_c0_g1_i1:361-2475(+)
MLTGKGRWAVAILVSSTWVFFLYELGELHGCLPAGEDSNEDEPPRGPVQRLDYREACSDGGDVLVTMASSPARKLLVPLVIHSLLKQKTPFDCMVAVLNEYKEVPSTFPSASRLAYHLPSTDLGACGKFFDRNFINKFTYHLAADDDIVYPYDYILSMTSTVRRLGGFYLVGVHCRKLSILANGGLVWFGDAVDYSKDIFPQLEISEELATTLFSAYHSHLDDVAHFEKSARGGFADVVGTGTFAYQVSKFNWTLDDIPPPGFVSDYHVAIHALAQGVRSWCIDRGPAWLNELPRSDASASGIYLALHRKKSNVVQLMEAVLQLDLLQDLRMRQAGKIQGRTEANTYLMRNYFHEVLQFRFGLLPMDCVAYKAAGHSKWTCDNGRLDAIMQGPPLWQPRLNESIADSIISETSSLPLFTHENCTTVHIVIHFGGLVNVTAVAASILSVTYQFYACMVVWLVKEDHEEGNETSATFDKLMQSSCERSTGIFDPAFAIVKGAFNQDVHVGCIQASDFNATAARGPGYRTFAGYNISMQYARPTDIILTVDGEDWLIHPQALSILAKAYNEKGCRCTWGCMRGRGFSIGTKLPREADVNGQARPREYRWVYVKPHSFRASLFSHMTAADFQDDSGEWLPMHSERNVIFRAIELSGPDRSCYLEAPIYGYYADRPAEIELNVSRKAALLVSTQRRRPSDRLLPPPSPD